MSQNSQILKFSISQIGRPKVEVMAERIRDINPDVEVIPINQYLKDQPIIDLVEQK